MTFNYILYRGWQIIVSFVPLAVSLYAKIFYKQYIESALDLAKTAAATSSSSSSTNANFTNDDTQWTFLGILNSDIFIVSLSLAATKCVEHALLSISEFV